MTAPMQSHQHEIRGSLDSRLEQLRGVDVDDDERDYWSPVDDVLAIDSWAVHDVTLAVGGPTQFFRLWVRGGDVLRAEFHDSWGWPHQVVELGPGTVDELAGMFGPWIGVDE